MPRAHARSVILRASAAGRRARRRLNSKRAKSEGARASEPNDRNALFRAQKLPRRLSSSFGLAGCARNVIEQISLYRCFWSETGVMFVPMSTALERPKKQKFSRASLEAGDRLLRAVKKKMLREKGKIDYASLRRQGYSEAMIARLRAI